MGQCESLALVWSDEAIIAQFIHLRRRFNALSKRLRPKRIIGCSSRMRRAQNSCVSLVDQARIGICGVSWAMNRRTGILLVCAFAGGLSSCDRLDPQWKGWVYPDRTDTSVDWKLGSFATLKECREAAQSMIDWLPDPTAADYECGYQCKPSDFLSRLDVCAVTRR